ncbi:MAG: MBL fold metallo-hydrolase [bacterium]|nr:MBL fold metallo-hydrolase [bacterium]
MIIEKFTVGSFQENTWLVGECEGGDAFVVDPGGETNRIIDSAAAKRLKIRAVLNTHGHIDHIAGAAELCTQLAIPFRMHADDNFMLDSIDQACAMFGLPSIEAPVLGDPLQDGEIIKIGGMEITVIHTPGHSPGGVSLLVNGHLFAGDTLFAGSIGRSDLPGGDMDTLMTSITDKLIDPLPAGTIVHCGHLSDTTLAEEAATNPFIRQWRG